MHDVANSEAIGSRGGVVTAIAAGRIIDPQTARSQVIGGVVQGIGQALQEETRLDHTLGRFMNHSFAEDHVPMSAAIEEIAVNFFDEDDRIVRHLAARLMAAGREGGAA